jgi:hypothetical protein
MLIDPRLRIALVSAAAAALASTAGAQKPAPVVVRAVVTDTTNAPLANTAVAIIHGRDSVMLAGLTSAAGRYTFKFQMDSALHRITARQIGYLATTRLIRARPGDTVDVALVIARVPPMLDTVHVDARVLSDDYHIGADMIAGVTRPLFDIHDAIVDLRPNMLDNEVHNCGPTRNIWIDGVLEQWDSDAASYPKPPGGHVDVDLKGNVKTPLAPHVSPHHIDPEAVLAKVNPQHVLSVDYIDCWHDPLHGSHTRNALFITLKPGYTYIRGRGSVSDDSLPTP